MAARRVSGTCLATIGCVAAMALPAPAAAAAGALSPSPTSLGFTSVAVGTGKAEAVTFTNAGTTTTMGAMALEAEEPPGQFEIEPALTDCDGAVLEDAQSCVINIAFHPTAAGEKKATLVVNSDAENSP